MPRTKASNEAQYRYNAAHLKRVPLDMQKSTYEEIKAHAEARNESINGFIKRAISEAMARDKSTSGAADEHKEV